MSDNIITLLNEKPKKNTMDDKTVLFTWNFNVSPIAVSLDYLFKETVDRRVQLIPSIPSETFPNIITDTYKYLDSINVLKQEYGLQSEYYKNVNGDWVDMEIIRSNQHVFMHTSIQNQVSTETELTPYLYADNIDILGEDFKKMVLININDIPKTRFIDSDGVMWDIHFSDGKYADKDEYKFKQRIIQNLAPVKLLTPDFEIPRFTVELFNYANRNSLALSGVPGDNNHHLFDDIKITFMDTNGDPLCDCEPDPDTGLLPDCDCPTFNKDILISINGLFFNYISEPTNKNIIYILDVVKFASIQQMGIKENVASGINSYLEFDNVKAIETHDLNVPTEYKILDYKFDINIFKWDNVTISTFVQPINTVKTLKNESITDEHYYLTTKLIFSEPVDLNKCLIIRDSTILSKEEYKIEQLDRNTVSLTYINKEFDILMSEIRKELDEYLYNEIHNLPIPEPMDYPDFESYVTALNDFIAVYGYDIHGKVSALTIVKQQFDNIKYSLIRLDSLDDRVNLYVYENTTDMIVNSPYQGTITINNYNYTDLFIFNGLNRKIEQLYDKTYKIPDSVVYNGNYSPDIYDNSHIYKLELLKDVK